MADFKVPLIIRGEIIEDYEVEYGDRGGGRSFITPNVHKYIDRVVNKDPLSLADLYTISLEEIYHYLEELGERLDLDSNPHWREAFEVSCGASNLSRSVLEGIYRSSPGVYRRELVSEVVETRIGSRFLEGWAPTRLFDGREIQVRAMGSRAAHIIAGNIPVVAISTVLRAAVTRNDSILKLPSKDPLTAIAIARTMIEMAPEHPLTKHLTVAYWKGGDEKVEEKIYHPAHLEKLVAWGGFASIKHVTKYLQPGIDLITLDPKSSTTLIGREALADEATMREAARRAAADLGGRDQEACSNARVMYLESGVDAAGLAKANTFGRYIYEALQQLPKTISAGAVRFDPRLMDEIEAILPLEDFYRVYTDPHRIAQTGAVIVSQLGEQVDFSNLLYGRVGNLVPVDNLDEVLRYFSAATKTVGFYPDTLKARLRDRAALAGAQAFVPLGYAISGSLACPQDSIEPERRMCRWIVDHHCDPAVTPGPWMPRPVVRQVNSDRISETA
jgi:hypothetical protein